MPLRSKIRCLDKRTSIVKWSKGHHNLHAGLNLSKYFEATVESARGGNFPYYFEHPIPLTNDCTPLTKNWKDIGTDIVEKSLAYHKELNILKERLVCNKKLGRIWNNRLKIRKQKSNGEGPYNIYPVDLLNYTKYLELNPHPEFEGGYNWYLTGGSLSVVQQNDKNYIVRPFGPELNHLDISPIHKKGNRIQSSKGTRYDLSSSGAINEIRVTTKENELIIATRNKENIGILRHSGDAEPVLKSFDSKTPYVSCDISPHLHLATTSTDKQMKIFDITSDKTLNKIDLEYVASLYPDNWSCVRHYESNSYFYADRRNLRIIDARTKVIGSPFNMTDYGEVCDFISYITPSKRFEHLMYVGTTHRVFAIDLRKFPGVIDDYNLALSWTHMMNLPPSMMQTTVINDAEMIILSSNLPGDMRIILTEYGTEYKNVHLPIRPPSIQDSLYLAKDNFLCLNPIASVNRRVRLCVNGVDFMTNCAGNISIISQNSICDLFKQNVKTEVPNDIENVCKSMKNWMDIVDSTEATVPETKEFSVTAVINKKDMIRVFKSTKLRRPTLIEEELEAAKPKERPRWKKTVAELAKYKDALVESIMEVWDFSIESEEEDFKLPEDDPDNLDNKIRSWLQKSEYNFDDTMDQEEIINDDKEKEEKLNLDTSYSQFRGESNIIQTSTQLNPVVQIERLPMQSISVEDKSYLHKPPSRSTVVKKRKHVMGF